MSYSLDKIRKRNSQIYEIYRQVLITVSCSHVETRLKRDPNSSIESLREEIQPLLYCIERDAKTVHFERSDGLDEFAHQYKLPILKNFFYKSWKRRLILLLDILRKPRSSRKHPYDDILIQYLYPGSRPSQRHALIRKDLERLKSRFPQLGPILKAHKPLTSDFIISSDQQAIPEAGTYCVSYRYSGDHLDLGAGYCDFADCAALCSGKTSLCTQRGKLLGTDGTMEYD